MSTRCDNCSQDILAPQYDVHVIRCKRFNPTGVKTEITTIVEPVTHKFDDELLCECGEQFRPVDRDIHYRECIARMGTTLCICGEYVKPSDEEHQKTCMANYFKCNLCDKEITFYEADSHEIVCRQRTVNCHYCNKEFTKQVLQDHENKCDQKVESCKYCSQQFLIKEHLEHEFSCGSKTAICDICKIRIQMRYMEEHLQIHAIEVEGEAESEPYQCTYCDNKYKTFDELQEHHILHTL